MTDMAKTWKELQMLSNLPEIYSRLWYLNFGDESLVVVNTPNDLRKAAKRLKEIKVKPEIEAFDLGNMWFGAQLYKEGLLDDRQCFKCV